jgi:hypothetical protein
MKPATKLTITTPPLCGDALQDLVRHVAWHVAQRARRRVAEDDGGGAGGQRIGHGRGRHVREVDQHAQPVHLRHHLAAQLGQAAVPRRIGRGVGQVVGRVVGQGQVARSQLVERAQRAERALQHVAALHPQQRRDASAAERIRHLVRGPAGRQVGRMSGDHASRQVDLLQLHARQPRPRLPGDVDAPELTTDPAGAQAGEVGLAGRRG